MTVQREPAEGLETAIASGRSGDLDVAGVVNTLLSSILFVPSGAEVSDGRGQVQPVLFDRGGVAYMAVFTAMDRIGDFAEMAPYAVALGGSDVVRGLAPGSGLVVNPGDELGFEVDPSTLDSIRSYLATA